MPAFPSRPPEVRVVSFFNDRAGFTYPVETYDDWVLLGCTNGAAFDFAIGTSPAQLCEPGQFVICPPARPLARKARGVLGFCLIRFRWPHANPRRWAGRHELRDARRMRSTFDHLKQLSQHAFDADAAVWASHLVADLLHQGVYERSTAAKTSSVDGEMLRAADMLGTDLKQNNSIDQVAAALGMEPWHLSRRFKQAFGASPVAYRTAARMQEAKRLLIDTTLTLQSVAEACGYESAFYFSRVFTRATGQSPGRYRTARRV